MYTESKSIFVEAERGFWSNTTFTLRLVTRALPSSFAFLDHLHEEQVSLITRLEIDVDIAQRQPTTVHLRSGSESDSCSWTFRRMSVCRHPRHRVYPPQPLSIVDHALFEEHSALAEGCGLLPYRSVRAIVWQWRETCTFGAYVKACVDCSDVESVNIAVRSMRRAGLMAVVAWTSDTFSVGL